MTGAQLIAKERQRQIDEEGFTPEHDDKHQLGQLAEAAALYAEQGGNIDYVRKRWRSEKPPLFPFGKKGWKPAKGDTPADRIRDLTKAGALIAAEIDRLQRLEDQ